MINAENVKYLNEVLRHILDAPGTQATHLAIKKLCDGDEDLAVIAARQINAKPFKVKLSGSLYKNDVVVNDKLEAEIFLSQGGFEAEYAKLHPPKTPAELLNEHFYMIVKKGQIFPIEEAPDEVHNMNDALQTYGLLDYDKSKNRLFPSKQGLVLAFTNGTIQDYILKLSKPNPQPATINVNGNYVGGSNYNSLSTVNNGQIVTGGTFTRSPFSVGAASAAVEDNPKYKKWAAIGTIVGGLIVSIAAAVKMFVGE